MLERYSSQQPQGTRAQINKAYRIDELTLMNELISSAVVSDEQLMAIRNQATQLVEQVRYERKKSTGIDSFLTEYSLSSDEGIALMCLAEALLRVPDNATIDSLIKDKLTAADWKAHRGQSDSFFVNATTWALMLTGKVLTPESAESTLSKAILRLINRSGEGVVRKAVDKAMRIMSKQFVMGRTISEALSRARKKESIGYRYSYDMLGEAALTRVDAARYFQAYKEAIDTIGRHADKNMTIYQRPGISIKLSALHPRYNESQRERVMNELPPKLLALAQAAKSYDIAMTIDAEESERLELSLDVIEQVFCDDSLHGWHGFGMAVQSYQKRAFYLLDWVAELARRKQRRMMVRLIKGAYWDSEIKKTQMQGLSGYPVFTRKVFTDVSFQACAKKLLTMTDAIYPQFATHNAYSVAMILNIVGNYRDFEFQCLHGMGNELYEQIVPAKRLGIPCRIYAPVGSHEDLLPYLVRRLLENGANSSFVNRIVDEKAPISTLVDDPVSKANQLLGKINQNIPLPSAIFSPERKNSSGFDFSDREAVAALKQQYADMDLSRWQAKPVIAGRDGGQVDRSVTSPQQPGRPVGRVSDATREDIDWALTQADAAFPAWSTRPVSERAACLTRYADLLEENRATLLAMACLEAGKTWNDGVAEVREAIDFCRYYAAMATKLMAKPLSLHGYTGEINELSLHGRGTVLCISPWNFPLAIFTGQVVAALVTGNCVIAKPAEQTPIIATFAVQLMHQAGIPAAVVQLLPGTGESVGAPLVADKRIKAVLFTGSTQTANLINQTLASRGGEIIPLIAETGGQNAMIVDSSALLEQVAVDAVTSAFGSAGQRCSALRVLYVQDDVYPRLVELLKGAMEELQIGDPRWLSTDIGPVIDSDALEVLKSHVNTMLNTHELIYQCSLPEECSEGYFMPPTAIAIDSIASLEKEVFGPILHVIRYKRKALDQVINEINNTGYGLTLGIHSRINQTVEYIRQRVHAGNCYVNRNMIGAVVGLQPFGGEGLSGTGPKAGGPYYLLRLCHERTYTVDTTAAGGNASLMSLPEGL
ncbi:bifunctional proline dehydrogenase/L-glutamate gamma-semialdehyde dehydrogenase PutA [Legionella taurinensis]|uniref:Bifunctional protein PutA n=1 Tax=Legionella taurinensis TaxID=70611 RepID=A0AB38N5Q4_9GAMM|nr:bifunctional proline dehydrogenase/L-glutamate gamma-semialdehyde dehydrogenase PutA [Legionella taurinensis]MDX1836920.1 bifunctional proline dehydrogenase/L-glutamate gamma-semialdehyde dehydrogenase PutA [Legionella taurinensis]PUT41330.1 bifunctional proline dehydrogenase/L-glutamate gamma-semialdehyde dehydrogenase [Legionella taurinensis]PUT42568.1 bifunctional proline dehydrogenase/L-glutamate gamma-semialdehyde dehydrogenase [Legionella taurinensis]PUT46596.1 bifunctional proline deh